MGVMNSENNALVASAGPEAAVVLKMVDPAAEQRAQMAAEQARLQETVERVTARGNSPEEQATADGVKAVEGAIKTVGASIEALKGMLTATRPNTPTTNAERLWDETVLCAFVDGVKKLQQKLEAQVTEAEVQIGVRQQQRAGP
jgi:hypothetical protein